MKISLYLALITLLAGLGACKLSAPQQPLPLSTPVIPTTQPLLPTLTATTVPATAVPGALYTLTIQNRLPNDIFIFVDGQYRLRVAAGSSNAYAGMPAGNYTLMYCMDAGMNSCAEPIEVTLAADVVLITGGGFSAELLSSATPPGGLVDESPTVPPASPTPETAATIFPATEIATFTPSPTIVTPTQTASLPYYRASPATLTAAAPTLAALAPTMTAIARSIPPTDTPLPDSQDRFTITVHNRYPFPLRVAIDDQYLMTVPAHMYMWHLNIKAGLHIFEFCPGTMSCLHREINVVQDTVIYVSP